MRGSLTVERMTVMFSHRDRRTIRGGRAPWLCETREISSCPPGLRPQPGHLRFPRTAGAGDPGRVNREPAVAYPCARCLPRWRPNHRRWLAARRFAVVEYLAQPNPMTPQT